MNEVNATDDSRPGRVDLPTALRAKAGSAATRAADYLRSRQSPDGGFCFYRWQGIEEPTLHDTWHAIAALTLLGVEVPRHRDVEAFLRAFDAEGLDDLLHRTLALDRLGVEPGPALRRRIGALDAAAAFSGSSVPLHARLERALRIVGLQRRFGMLRTPQAIAEGVRALAGDDGWGDKPSLTDTWLALAILDACGARGVPAHVRAFVEALQVPSFGFTDTRDSSYAQLDVVHAGLRTCALLALPLRHAADAIGFVLACQTDNGSFARTPDALPDIALTHRGLLALAASGALPVPDTPGWRDDWGL